MEVNFQENDKFICCVNFLAAMLDKYGDEVLAEMREAEESSSASCFLCCCIVFQVVLKLKQ